MGEGGFGTGNQEFLLCRYAADDAQSLSRGVSDTIDPETAISDDLIISVCVTSAICCSEDESIVHKVYRAHTHTHTHTQRPTNWDEMCFVV